ncbi:MAG: helix-turn-helix transcriptional regulator [Clostridia bacterium]|nr:helix-turn-helix transcriptional regulator [Clostridia bacterium]
MILSNAIRVENDFSILAFNTVLDYRWDAEFVFLGEQHDFWEIVYVLSGEVECAEDERVYQLRAGEMLLHAPMEFHKIRSAANTEPHLYVLTFAARGALPDSLKDGIFCLSDTDRERYEAFFKELHSLYVDGQTGEDPKRYCAFELASFLFRLALKGKPASNYSHELTAKEYRRAVNAMQQGLYDNLTLAQIAATCHISISYLKVLFARYAGISPKAYYSKMRYNEALNLLKKGLSAAEVAARMNFSSPNYFSVFMKRYAGLPPAKFVKRL